MCFELEFVLKAGASSANDGQAKISLIIGCAGEFRDAARGTFCHRELIFDCTGYCHRAKSIFELVFSYLSIVGSIFNRSRGLSKRFDRWRASYASDPEETRGRRYPEPDSVSRSDFQRDRDRIIHSASFRRLKHKTQVFVYHEGDHYRTRLTHTIEVAQIARSIARALGLDEDLAEALALAHDLGHTPFGHTGEDALNSCMADFGGFDHNAQTFRIVTKLEKRYPDFDGLNLSWETLEGLVKHNGPLLDRDGRATGSYTGRDVPLVFVNYDQVQSLELSHFAGPEAQVAALADDIAYNCHDIDDGLRAGFFKVMDLKDIPFLKEVLLEIDDQWPTLEQSRVIHELGRRLITRFVEGVIEESRKLLIPYTGKTASDIRMGKAAIVAFTAELAGADRDIKNFLFPQMYRQADVLRIRGHADRIVRDLFERLCSDPALLPEEWGRRLEALSEAQFRRRIADYIAGMTDRFAMNEHRRLFDVTPELR